MLRAINISFSYPDSKNAALKNVSFEINKGDYAVILGTNGSGKSTLARIMAGFLAPDSGEIKTDENLMTGIVFQSPKEQVVSEIVSHDTAFGPENLGLNKAETEQRVIESLSATDLLDKAFSSTSALSLGQTQKLAASGILALHPDILILDEATSMLDPQARKELLDFIDASHRRGQTIVHITHDFNEVLRSNHVIVLEKGRLAFDGGCENFKTRNDLIKNLFGEPISKNPNQKKRTADNPILVLQNLSFSYDGESSKKDSENQKSCWSKRAEIENFNLEIQKGTLNAITGPSGSGKSTVLELAAGILNPSTGKIFCAKRPALALQDASSALFEAFAADDVAFGPRNLGIKGKKLKNLVKDSMNLVNLPFDEFADRGTFMLSGGEKRKLALAGILAMDSDVILLDEPTAGLDPKSRRNLMEQLKKLTENGKTVVFSTHRMDEADFADRHISMFQGKIVSDTDISAENEPVSSRDESADNSCRQSVESADKMPPEAQKLEGTGFLERLRKTKIFGENPETHKKNIFQKISAVPKYCIFISLFALSLLFNDICLSTAMVLICIIYGALAAFPAKRYLSSFLIILPWMIFFCAFQLIISIPAENDVIYYQLGWLTITKSKIVACINLVLHTFSAFCSVRVFIYSTSEREFLDGISGILHPLELLKIPVRNTVVIIEIIFRFIPLLIEELCSIVKTQIVRGGLGKAKSLGAKIKILLPLFIPLIIQTVKRSESLADALTARKF